MPAVAAPDVYADAARELASWDLTPESARRLRDLAKALPAVRGQLEGAAERALQRVRGCYLERRPLGVSTVQQAPELRRVASRILFAFVATWLLSGMVSGLVLWSLAGTTSRTAHGMDIPFFGQWLLWTRLSQFLGLFLGLVVQGRRLGRG